MDVIDAIADRMGAEPLSNTINPLWSIVLGVLLIPFLVEYWLRNKREFILTTTIPGPPRVPLLGNAHLFIRGSNAKFWARAREYLNTYGEVTRLWLGPVLLVIISNPEDVKTILSGTTHLEKSEEYRYFKPWFGDGLLISNGHHWRHHRKMIAPTFHQSILKSFIPTFVQHSKKVVQRMSKEVGQEFDVHEYMSQTTVDILLTTAMGVKQVPDDKKSLEYANAVLDMCDIIHKRQLQITYRWDALFMLTGMSQKASKMMDIILGMTRKMVKDRMADFNADDRAIVEEDIDVTQQKQTATKVGLRDDLDDIDEDDAGVKKRLALLDAMMAMSRNQDIEWTDKDVIDEVNTIMFEGHDTTSAGSSFVLCMMGIHKDIQEKVLAEQKAIFGENFLRDCTYADSIEMKYLERVIMETLRLYPPVPVIARRVEHDVELGSGPYVIPSGSTVVIVQYAIHRNPKYFPNPEKFDPDNFLPERMANRHYYSFIPFSAGPRSCVGRKYAMLKLKVLLSTILRNYVVDCRQKEEDLKLQADIILKIENGFNVVLQPRQQTAEVA